MKEDARWSAVYPLFDPLEVHVRGKERSSSEEIPRFHLGSFSSPVRWPKLRQLLVANARHGTYISCAVLSDEPFTLVFDLSSSRDEPDERWIRSIKFEMDFHGLQSEQVKEFVVRVGAEGVERSEVEEDLYSMWCGLGATEKQIEALKRRIRFEVVP